MKKFKINVQPTILGVFAILTGIAVFVTLGLQYYFSKQLALNAVETSVSKISQSTIKELESIDNDAYKLVSVLELMTGKNDISQIKNEQLLLKKYTTLIDNNPLVYALYVGDSKGRFYEVINLDIDKSLRKRYKTQKEEKWLVIKIMKQSNGSYQTQNFLNKNLEVIRQEIKKTDYNPTKRIWYKQASKYNSAIKTSPYQFSNFDSLGITYAKSIPKSRNTVGVDISLKSLAKFVKKQSAFQEEKIYLTDTANKTVLASYPKGKNNFDDVQKLIKDIGMEEDNIINIGGKEYFAVHKKLFSNYSSSLVILIPEEEIMRPYNEKILYAIGINIVMMVLILPMIWYFSRIIVIPVEKLQLENEKVRNREYEKVSDVHTPIKELSELSKSLVSMSHSIKEYENMQAKLMDSFIKIIADAIDAKSEYTGGHCNRVPILTLDLAKAASEDKEVFQEFSIKDEDELREISIAAWLHDCGKITMPEHIVDKATKLETIYNRIHEIRMRFEVVYRDRLIEYYKMLQEGKNKSDADAWLKENHTKLQEDFEFVANANIGGEFMDEAHKERIKEIAKTTWVREFDNTIGLSQEEEKRMEKANTSKVETLLADKKEHIIERSDYSQENFDRYGFKMDVPKHLYNLGEVYNLTIEKGTLSAEDRFKINEHIIMTIKMLEQLPFPSNLKRVPEYAGGHHETLIGTGYPRKLTAKELSTPARVMALADVFEALTASDRPYKKGKTLSEAIKIMGFMVKDSHLDKDLFKLFLKRGLHLEYAKAYLKPEQIDEVDIQEYLEI